MVSSVCLTVMCRCLLFDSAVGAWSSSVLTFSTLTIVFLGTVGVLCGVN